MAASRGEGRPQTDEDHVKRGSRETADRARRVCEGTGGDPDPALGHGGERPVKELADKIVALESSREISAELFSEIRRLAERYRTKVNRDCGRGK